MFSKRSTKCERECIRAHRQEAQLIISRAKERRFVYVVNPPVIPKVAFGSGLDRETLPRSGPCMTSFMRRHQGEVRDYPGPFEHVVSRRLCRHHAKVHSAVFASKTPRMLIKTDSSLPPGAYDVTERKQTTRSVQPLSLGGSQTLKSAFLTPGPPTYPYHTPYPKYKVSNAFGCKRVIWPAVAVFCTRNNIAKCSKCGGTPFGDYWHNFTSNADMCRPCMNKEQRALKNCATSVFQRMLMRRDLQQFQPARYCGFFHNHNGTSAALQIMPTKTLRYKIKTENYLYLYEKR